ncbi:MULTISPECIES: MaoC/PaaZ C-terminal domain-containing protein [unclassified Moraxella]|uniref:MaoC family dehydratase n=1 Tax=unclassified Moraxella TaxID=2685852 RepID=UPI003AF8A4DF
MSDQHFKALPKPHTTYANIIKSLLPIGDHEKLDKCQLPQATYTVDNLQIDHDNLADYRKICGFDHNSYVPPTYFAVLSQALQMNMMVKEPFPFAMLGLVHVENSVTQYRLIQDSSEFKMAVSFANLREHDKGQQFDFITQVYEKDELVWQGTSTYLSRQKRKKPNPSPSANQNPSVKPELDENDMHNFWEIPEDIGRRYAFVSGDFNLIHLHPLSAKAFGFPKAIAHGMWTKAKCLASLGDLLTAFRCDVSFKLPIFLPSEVEFIAKYDNRDEQIDFGVYDVNSPKPHLIGQVVQLATENN